MPKPQPSSLMNYRGTFSLFPLKKGAKTPRHNGWRTRQYTAKDMIAWMKKGGNVGIRLRHNQVVMDVDPRNFDAGEDSLEELSKDFNLDLTDTPCVVTGTGGFHYYFTKPRDMKIRKALDGYPGIDFKTMGGYVVAAGSIHPDTNKLYRWGKPVGTLCEMPDNLLGALERVEEEHEVTDSGIHSAEEVGEMLAGLDPQDFSDYEDWVRIMMACYHASDGDALEEFIDWSASDPNYAADAADAVEAKWSTCKGEGVSASTLYYYLNEAGESERIPRTSAAEDFDDEDFSEKTGIPSEDGPRERPMDDDDSWLDGLAKSSSVPLEEDGVPDEPEPYSDPYLYKLNKKYAFVEIGSDARMAHWRTNPKTKERSLRLQKMQTFKDKQNKHAIEVETRDKDGNVKRSRAPAGDTWARWYLRRDAELVFDPDPDRKYGSNVINEWQGWAVKPKKGDWSYVQSLIKDVLCETEEAVEYVLDWMADMVQRPHKPAEVAICFHGKKGTGKTTLGLMLQKLCGGHGSIIGDPSRLMSNFNQHMRNKVFVLADEAIKPTDRSAESRLKHMLTGMEQYYEAKGLDMEKELNYAHYMMASNYPWIAAISVDERRYFISEANDSRKGDLDWFDALYDQMLRKGGLEAMLYDLLERDISGWRPRRNIPKTSASFENLLNDLSPIKKWWYFGVLLPGILDRPFVLDVPAVGETDMAEWATEGVYVFKEDLRQAYAGYSVGQGNRNPNSMNKGTDANFSRELGEMLPKFITDRRIKYEVPDDHPTDTKGDAMRGRADCYYIPSLKYCRDSFTDWVGYPIDWEDDDDWLY